MTHEDHRWWDNPFLITAIIVAVGIAIAIAVALWINGLWRIFFGLHPENVTQISYEIHYLNGTIQTGFLPADISKIVIGGETLWVHP